MFKLRLVLCRHMNRALVMKNWVKNIIALAFFTAIVFVSVGSRVNSDQTYRQEWGLALPESRQDLSVIEFGKEAESIIEPKLNLFIPGGSLKALLQ